MNVINDPWLWVEYNNGSTKQVSVRTAFKDADSIRSLVTPFFHKTKGYLYITPVVQFFATVLQASYYKPEHNFKNKHGNFYQELMQTGWDDDILFGYLDKWESRFELFDPEHPFMQKADLESDGKDGNSYISTLGPLTPSMNSAFFGKIRSNCSNFDDIVGDYQFNLSEFVYILLYVNAFGHSPSAMHYPNKALSVRNTLTIIPTGKNLKETIIYNCIPLVENTRPNEEDDEIFYDRPVWELDSVKDILKIPKEDLPKNTLLCTFFPCYPLRAIEKDGKIASVALSHTRNDVIFPEKETMESLQSAYVPYNPWAIRKSDKSGEQQVFSYKPWNPEMKLIGTCIEITAKLPAGNYCTIIDNEFQRNHNAECYVYYKEYDGMMANILSCGVYKIRQEVFEKLQNEEFHEKAVKFNDRLTRVLLYLDDVRKAINKTKSMDGRPVDCRPVLATNLFKREKQNLMSDLTIYFMNDFVENIENEDALTNAYAVIRDQALKMVNGLPELCNSSSFIAIQQAISMFSKKLYALDKKDKT